MGVLFFWEIVYEDFDGFMKGLADRAGKGPLNLISSCDPHPLTPRFKWKYYPVYRIFIIKDLFWKYIAKTRLWLKGRWWVQFIFECRVWSTWARDWAQVGKSRQRSISLRSFHIEPKLPKSSILSLYNWDFASRVCRHRMTVIWTNVCGWLVSVF